jgi:hypothetical protein
MIADAIYIAVCAVVFAVVLVDDGMLLAPVQQWLREKHLQAWMRQRVDEEGLIRPALIDRYYTTGKELDSRWWWKPLWGCHKCVAGQWGFWGYLIRCYVLHVGYSLFQHMAFTCLTIFLACLIHKLYQWSQQ